MDGRDARVSRRRFLVATSAAVTPVLSGCNSASSQPGSTTKSSSPSANQHDLAVSKFTVSNASFVPVVTDQPQATASVTADVSDENGLKSYRLLLAREQSDAREIASGSLSGNSASVNAEIPTRVFAPGQNRLRLTVTDTTGKTTTVESDPLTFDPRGYRLDPTQDFGQYQTKRAWDDTAFSQDHINQLRENWQTKAYYDGFVEELRSGKAFSNFATEYPEGKEFDLQQFTKAEDFRTVVNWIQPTVRYKTFEVHEGPPSAHANEMAASGERAINTLHPSASTRAWGVYNPGHGTMMFYNEAETADRRWFHVDTTSSRVQQPEEAMKYRVDIWSPFRSSDADQPGFHQGFTVDGVTGVHTYEQMKNHSVGALTRMVLSGRPQRWGEHVEGTFITDEWLDAAYSHIRAGGNIDPVLSAIEEYVGHQLEYNEYTGIYGPSLDDTRLVAGPDLDDLYEDVMVKPGAVSTREVEARIRNG